MKTPSNDNQLPLTGEADTTPGGKLRKARMVAGLSQDKLAAMTDGVVSRRAISAMENNRCPIPAAIYSALEGFQDRRKLTKNSAPKKGRTSKAFKDGVAAFLDNRAVASCPHNDPLKRREFINGWYSAQADAQDSAA